MKTIVSEKGQITIPKPIRERLGIRSGQVLEIVEESGRLIATKASEVDRLESVYGILSAPKPSTDQFLASIREVDVGDPSEK